MGRSLAEPVTASVKNPVVGTLAYPSGKCSGLHPVMDCLALVYFCPCPALPCPLFSEAHDPCYALRHVHDRAGTANDSLCQCVY